MFCSNCGQDLTGIQGGFCSKCGTKIAEKPSTTRKKTTVPKTTTASKTPVESTEEEIFCAKCGSKNKISSKLCANCGTTLGANTSKFNIKFPAKMLIPVLAVLLVVVGVFMFLGNSRNGNTGGNIINNGYAAIQRNRIFYSNYDDGWKIYTIKTDGSDRRKLNDDSSRFINVVGNRIFYSNYDDGWKIYTIKTDGSDRRKLNDDTSGYINVVGNRIFYINSDEGNKIYTIKTDGSDRLKLNDDNSHFINVVGNRIFYSNNVNMYTIKTDGSGRQSVEQWSK